MSFSINVFSINSYYFVLHGSLKNHVMIFLIARMQESIRIELATKREIRT